MAGLCFKYLEHILFGTKTYSNKRKLIFYVFIVSSLNLYLVFCALVDFFGSGNMKYI